MATMEDRLMGEKLHYYCSSDDESEEEDDNKNEEENEEGGGKSKEGQENEISEKDAFMNNAPRTHNTGVKGVKEDARAHQLYILHKEQEKQDQLAKAAARFSLNERPKSDDELDDDDDEFMAAYRSKRMMEMNTKASPTFGRIVELSDKDFVDVIDAAHPKSDVVVYVYEEHIAACRRYKECLSRIAQDFPKCMICHIRASKAHMSANFIQKGLPCFIKYRGGDVQKTWVNIRDYIGDDAEYDVLVEGLQDNGIIPYQ